MARPLVSIIIPAFNEEEVIERLLVSIQKQSYPLLEVIVVDDQSTDYTFDIARKYTEKVFKRPHAERSVQRNFGAKKSKGKYLLFLDADMQLSRNVVKECVGTAEGKANIGAIAKDKGFEDALKAFAEIKKRDKGWQFWMVGKASPDMVKQVKRLSESLGLGKNFKFWGYVSDKRKFELLARACVLINPSHHEGWGLVNIEANAAGTPVVAYDVAGCRDSVKDGKTGFLSKPGDYRSLADNILKLVNNRDLYGDVQKNTFPWSKKFTWRKAGKKSLQLIESL